MEEATSACQAAWGGLQHEQHWAGAPATAAWALGGLAALLLAALAVAATLLARRRRGTPVATPAERPSSLKALLQSAAAAAPSWPLLRSSAAPGLAAAQRLLVQPGTGPSAAPAGSALRGRLQLPLSDGEHHGQSVLLER